MHCGLHWWWYVSQKTIQIPRHILQPPLAYQFIKWVDANTKYRWGWAKLVLRWWLKGVGAAYTQDCPFTIVSELRSAQSTLNAVECQSVNSNATNSLPSVCSCAGWSIFSHINIPIQSNAVSRYFWPPVNQFKCKQYSSTSVNYGIELKTECNISTLGHTFADYSFGRQTFGQFIVWPEGSEFAWHMPDRWNGWVEPISLSDDDNNDRFATTKLMIKPFYDISSCIHWWEDSEDIDEKAYYEKQSKQTPLPWP